MKFFLIITVLVSSILNCSAQDSLYSIILKDAIQSRRDSNAIVYIDSSIEFYGGFSRYAKGNKVNGFIDLKSMKRTSMKFTRRELREIDQLFSDHSNILWPENYIPNSVRMPYDSILSYTKYQTTPEFLKHGKYKFYYLFSQPVYIRNRSVAIFNLAEMINHSAGHNLVFIYVKENEVWKRKMAISIGAW